MLSRRKFVPKVCIKSILTAVTTPFSSDFGGKRNKMANIFIFGGPTTVHYIQDVRNEMLFHTTYSY